MNEFKFSNKLKLFSYIIAPILIGGFAYIGFIPFIKDYALLGKLLLIGLYVFFIFAVIMSVIEAVKTKLVVNDQQFIKTGIFSIRTLKFDEIEGYRIDGNYFYLIPKNDKKKERSKLLSNKKYGRNENEIIAKINEMGFEPHWTMKAEAQEYRESVELRKRQLEIINPN